jgi:adenylosuccinate lyase
MDIYNNISPLDFRYYIGNKEVYEKLNPYLSENAFIKYQLKVELALIKAFVKKNICDDDVIKEVEKAINEVKAEEIYEEEKKTRHNIKALVNCIRNKVSDKAKSYIHFTATSFDIFDTANSLRYKDTTEKVIIPALIELEKKIINIALREKSTLQIGRTHGQHAIPITFGFAMSEFVSRLGHSILKIKNNLEYLKGKMSGAVGAYNAQTLFFNNPEEIEKLMLGELNLEPALHSTQIIQPEFLLDLIHNIITCFGILANLADNIRHLQRSEINEVAEKFENSQVGSSTMPHKRNPWNFENIKSMWKEFMPRINTIYMDQISEHQRDLTNSASQRFIPEIFAGFLNSVLRMSKLMDRLVVDKNAMKRNFDMNKDMIIAEPLYLLLAYYGHPDAHEIVRILTLKSKEKNIPLSKLIFNNNELREYFDKFTKEQLDIINNPEKYIGISIKKTEEVCEYWEKQLNLNREKYNNG